VTTTVSYSLPDTPLFSHLLFLTLWYGLSTP
jgi:hypothetical protein